MLPPPDVPHRWLWLALPDDCRQIAAIIDWQYPNLTPLSRKSMLSYSLRKLRHEVWDRYITRPPRIDTGLRPSKIAKQSGYRTNSSSHSTARMRLTAERRSEIAKIARAAQLRKGVNNGT